MPTGGRTHYQNRKCWRRRNWSQPLNLQPIIVADPKHDPVHFSWKPVATAKLYDFQASTTSMFNHIVMDKKTSATSVDITGFDPGDYFWRVRAIDEKNNVSDASDSFKFTLVAQGKEQEMLLEVDDTELHGNVVEVIGRTEPGAALIINGEQVADIQSGRAFPLFHRADGARQPRQSSLRGKTGAGERRSSAWR